jgi:hypothetical protein
LDNEEEDKEKEVEKKELERAVRLDTVRFFGTTSRASPNPPFTENT